MSTFRDHKTIADRSVSDRRRHKTKIEKAIKEGIHNIVAEESIIGKDGKKKIKIPVRGIKEYRFIYGENDNNQQVGSAAGKEVQRGQKVGDRKSDGKQNGSQEAGDQKGEEFYDVEITLEELGHYLFNDLSLPDLERKKIKKILSERVKRHGYRNHGIRPRMDKKETVKRKLRRQAAATRTGTYDPDDPDDNFSFHNEDLRYKHIKKSFKEASTAVIFFIMDVSGSMSTEKKYLARSFFFLLYHFIKHRYEHVELVFIAHDMIAHEVNEDQFFKRGSSGGTIVSSGYEMAMDVINKRYHPNNWNIYSFHCSDGDNFPQDASKANELAERLRDVCQLFGYCEIECDPDRRQWLAGDDSRLSNAFSFLEGEKFKTVKIYDKDDIWSSFVELFGGNVNV